MNARFTAPVYPGDTLLFKLDLISPIRRGICHMKGIIFVNGNPYIPGNCVGPCDKAPKCSEVNFSVSITNPTDINFNNFNLNLLINAKSGYTQTSISLPSSAIKTANVTWTASKEGPLSLTVEAVIVNYRREEISRI